ncbi:MAG: hypothetical protein VW879_15220 [Opitutae bacterium]
MGAFRKGCDPAFTKEETRQGRALRIQARQHRKNTISKGTMKKIEQENVELRKQLAEIIHLNQAVSMLAGLPTAEEMDTLVKDGKRLDWILSDEGNYWLSSRKDIDREMEEL